jgi:carbonic anhydrase
MIADPLIQMLNAARAWCADAAVSGPAPDGRVLVVAAPDLPVSASALTGAAAETLYLLTSPGALAPPSAETDPDFADASFAAGLEFALRVFRARHVLVLTHAGCGLVASLTGEADARSMAMAHAPALGRFAAMAGPAIARTTTTEAPTPERNRNAAMELVRASVENLMSYATLIDGVLGRHVTLQGWVLDPADSALWVLDPAEDIFRCA